MVYVNATNTAAFLLNGEQVTGPYQGYADSVGDDISPRNYTSGSWAVSQTIEQSFPRIVKTSDYLPVELEIIPVVAVVCFCLGLIWASTSYKR